MMQGITQVIQIGGVNVLVSVNTGTININVPARPIPKLLTTIPFVDEKRVVGRLPIMEKLARTIEENRGRQSIQLAGVGGIGKTTIAECFLNTHQALFSHICYLEVRSTVKHALVNSIQLVDSLGLHDEVRGKSQTVRFNLIVNRLQQLKGDNLLVLDNVSEEIEHSDLYSALSLSGGWSTVVTSRDPLLNYVQVPVDPLTMEDTVQLFYQHYTFETDDRLVEEIIRMIDYHTLTIEVVAKTSELRIFKLAEVLAIVKKKSWVFQKDFPRELRLNETSTGSLTNTTGSYPEFSI